MSECTLSPMRRPAAPPLAKTLTSACQNVGMSEPTPVRRPLLPPHLVKPLAIAFGIGLLLFFLLWLDQRSDSDFFKAGSPSSGATADGETLPAPVPADVASEDGNASGLNIPREGMRPAAPAGEQPRIIEPPAPPPPPPAPVAPTAVADSDAVPLSRPPPRYPQEALRRNIGGTVQVRASIATDGSVERMEVAESSGNRFLDRAAMEAVRRWTFKPAMRNGRATSSDVVVPIAFNPQN